MHKKLSIITTTIITSIAMILLISGIQNSFEQEDNLRNETTDLLGQQLNSVEKKSQVGKENQTNGIEQLPTRSELKSAGTVYEECKINPEILRLDKGESRNCVLTKETVIEALQEYVKIHLSPQPENQSPFIKKLQKSLF